MIDETSLAAEREAAEEREDMLSGAACSITAFCPAAEKVEARTLRVGDSLFDAYGGTHELVEVHRSRGWVDTVREDGWEDRFHGHDILTVLRGEG